MGMLEADRAKLTDSVYNVGAFSLSAKDIEQRVRKHFPDADVTYAPDAVRNKICDSWPEDLDDTRARNDWGWKPIWDVERAFEEYLLPSIKKRYAKE